MSAYILRARLLIEQSRYALAEEQLRMALAEDSSDADAHSMLAICLNEREAFQEATEEARQAIFHAPDDSVGHYALAVIMRDRNRLNEARDAINEAIRLNPWSATLFATLGSIEAKAGLWQKCLDAADGGLEADPEDAQCANLRSLALTKLGRRSEAAEVIAELLRQTPEDDFTHANEGWRQLHLRKPYPAMEHFREALRLNPDNGWARQGIIEAMKARNFIYRWMLSFFLWINGFSPKVQLALMLGLMFGQNILSSVLNAIPALAPITPFIALAYILFVWMTWSSSMLFNLALMTSSFGRLALAPRQKLEALLAGACVLLCIVSLIAKYVFVNRQSTPIGYSVVTSLMLLGLTVPLVTVFHSTKRRQKGAIIWTIGLLMVMLKCNVDVFTENARIEQAFVQSFPASVQPAATDVIRDSADHITVKTAVDLVARASPKGAFDPAAVQDKFTSGVKQIVADDLQWFSWGMWGIAISSWLGAALAMIPERR